MQLELPKLPNLFGGDDPTPSFNPSPAPISNSEFSSKPEGLIAQAKVLLSYDLGIQRDTLLDDDFVWLGPSLGSKVLNKQDYLAAGKFFDLR